MKGTIRKRRDICLLGDYIVSKQTYLGGKKTTYLEVLDIHRTR